MRTALGLVCILALAPLLCSQERTVSGRINIRSGTARVSDRSGVVVSLNPVPALQPQQLPSSIYRLTQKNKHFDPHLLVITVGSSVEFPNKDPFFHNVFSVYQGTRFDLGLYESGSSRTVRFTKPGPSYIFCNIHPQMSAVILALPTPHFAITNARGEFAIRNLPSGEYQLMLWYEHGNQEQLDSLSRRIAVGDSDIALPPLELLRARSLAEGHKDKYGHDYPADGYKIP